MNRQRDFEVEMQRALVVMRQELGNDNPTFADAVLSLHQQLAERGDTSRRLRDVQVHLDESGTSALLYANWSSDDCVFARFALPTQTTEDAFDAEAYVRLCEG
jgi:hypothetical protein